jgi:hypothetical protein
VPQTQRQLESWKANFSKKPPGAHGAASTGPILAPDKETDQHWWVFLSGVGGQLKGLRTGQGHSLANLASMLGLNFPGNLTMIEKGEVPGVSLYRIWKIADALGYETHLSFTRKTKERRRRD